MPEPFKHRFRVRYAEVDPQSVVFNSRYLEYADLLVTEFFRAKRAEGMPGELEFHVRRAEIDYLKPVRFDEDIEGRIVVERMGNSSMAMRVTLHGASNSEGDLRADIALVQVHVDLSSGEPQPIPDSVRSLFGYSAREMADG